MPMIKMIFCLRRLPHLSLAEFHHYWRDRHGPLVRELAPLLNIRRYVQSHSFIDPRIASPVAARGSGVAIYDGVAELWWDNIEDIIAAGNSREGRQAGRRLLADEGNFIDQSASTLFYTVEHDILTP